MKVLVYQAKPRLCLTSEAFIGAIDEIVGRLKSEHSPDLIIFPECMGLWMCMMEPISFLSRIFSRFLPRHSSTARVAIAGIGGGWSDDVAERMAISIQFARPSALRDGVSASSSPSLLGGIRDYDILGASISSQDEAMMKAGWIERIATWFFERLHLRFIGMRMRSDEELTTYLKAFSAAAVKHRVAIQAGSLFVFKDGRLLNIAFTFDEDGKIVSEQQKIHPIPFEGMLGVEGGSGISPFIIGGVKCGVAICADVNFKDDHVRALADAGCRVICCPSGGIVPSHMWKFDFEKDVAVVHLARSQETGTIICRSYNAGDLIPSVLMFQGRSTITAPKEMDEDGDGLISMVPEEDFRDEAVLVYEV